MHSSSSSPARAQSLLLTDESELENLDDRARKVKGNAPVELKKHLVNLNGRGASFGSHIFRRANITEVDVDTYQTGAEALGGRAEGKVKEVVRIVHELDVLEGMYSPNVDRLFINSISSLIVIHQIC